MVRILADQHVRQKSGTGGTFVDRAMRRGFLYDSRTAGATQFRPHSADHFETSRYVFQNLREVFPERTQFTAAVRASVLRRRDRFDLAR